MSAANEPLLRVRDLSRHFVVGRGADRRTLRAVDGVSFDLTRGETLGLVGESGSGKSTTGRSILRLLEPTSGQVFFDGTDVLSMDTTELRRYRGRAQIVFQDPFSSLNPRMTVGSMLDEALRVHGLAGDAAGRRTRVRELLAMVGLRPGQADTYPHELSGGQRQRVGIARALSVEPELIVLDEPVSALDVSVQAQVVNLLDDLKEQLGLTYLFIAHDLSVVEHVSDRVAVMYLGRIVEIADAPTLYREAAHPYTRALLSSIPVPDPTTRGQVEATVLEGDMPSPASPPPGCAFHPRCPFPGKDATCTEGIPPLVARGPGHLSACPKSVQ
jgi:oligopeptide/dipeptide ABC transporter ATP-binding protein